MIFFIFIFVGPGRTFPFFGGAAFLSSVVPLSSVDDVVWVGDFASASIGCGRAREAVPRPSGEKEQSYTCTFLIDSKYLYVSAPDAVPTYASRPLDKNSLLDQSH